MEAFPTVLLGDSWAVNVNVKMEHLVPEVLREGKVIKDYLVIQEKRVILETWAQEEYQVQFFEELL